MTRVQKVSFLLLLILLVVGGGFWYVTRGQTATLPMASVVGRTPQIIAPSTETFPTINIAKPVGWADGQMPTPAAGLSVNLFADGLDHPRWMTRLANGDVLVAESNKPPATESPSLFRRIQTFFMGRAGAGGASANRITLLRDADGDGRAEQRSVLLEGLNSPFGMAVVGDTLFVGNTDALMAYPFRVGQTRIDAPGRRVIALPSGTPNNHWTRNVIASPDGSRLYVTVGSNSNIGENGLESEEGRAVVLEVDPATGRHRVFTSGLRNPNGLAWEPQTNRLWTVVNERDMLGGDLVPDYLALVEEGAFYGWPWNYWGGYEDKRVQPARPDLREYTRRPDYALGPHVAALGLTFAEGAQLGGQFTSGAFIGLHGSWNRKPPSGYKVIYVPFNAGGFPTGAPVDVLTGFLDEDGNARGRPVGVILDRTGSLLVADDTGNRIWRVSGRAQ
ncbi:glucose/arabinose dehydrogenase [Sphingomonas jejuensis]|uniref:Glucose/arabinose dehydrogenase n=1 Tax=Sphingomonas jejuensis TaxID=904715 RepID=A0ABX0XPP2_9SPHN|nr:sorbosone dehydrogenase family protein [Sphingomonas jejuensis]NJC35260.1 glucose/arabinose dehydrogenase [Sphingomonas jejuensis]